MVFSLEVATEANRIDLSLILQGFLSLSLKLPVECITMRGESQSTMKYHFTSAYERKQVLNQKLETGL